MTLKREPAACGAPQHPGLPLAAGEVVLTFDDGPRPESTLKVLAALRQQCVQATFLMVGESLARNPAPARQVRAEGHSIGLHGYTHAHAAAQSEAEQLADLHDVQDRTADALPLLLTTLKARGYRVVHLEWEPVPSTHGSVH